MSELRFVHLGFDPDLVDYEAAWQEQRRVHAARLADEIPDTCLLLEHSPVYTAGRRTADDERPLDGTPVIDVDRGGKITWHGPGQLVGYPILKLPRPVDVVAHVRRLEEALIRTCAEFGLETTRVEGRSGVWVLGESLPDRPGSRPASSAGLQLDLAPGTAPGTAPETTPGTAPGTAPGTTPETRTAGGQDADEEYDPRLRGPEYAPSNAGQRGADRKLAAIGIRVAKGVTMHGFALNCSNDLRPFGRIIPCGITDASVTSLSQETGRLVTPETVVACVEQEISARRDELCEQFVPSGTPGPLPWPTAVS